MGSKKTVTFDNLKKLSSDYHIKRLISEMRISSQINLAVHLADFHSKIWDSGRIVSDNEWYAILLVSFYYDIDNSIGFIPNINKELIRLFRVSEEEKDKDFKVRRVESYNNYRQYFINYLKNLKPC